MAINLLQQLQALPAYFKQITSKPSGGGGGAGYTSPGTVTPQATNTYPSYPNNFVSTNPSLNKYAANTIKLTTTSGGGGGGGGGSAGGPDTSNINNQVDQYGDIINRDYETAMAGLASQESGLRSQAATSEAQIRSEAAPVQTQLGNEQQTNLQGVTQQQQTAEAQGKTAMQQARDLFRQTQQQNIAQLSGLGLSSSSVAEALGEKLGVDVGRRIAGVTGSLNEIRQNAQKEIGRINNYFQEKTTNLKSQVEVQVANLQNSLLQGLNQINQSRTQAASDKANRRQELLINAQNAMSQLQQQYNQFQQTLQTWQEQKTSALGQFVNDPNYLSSFLSNLNTLQTAPAAMGYDIGGQINQNAQGAYSGQYTIKKPTNQYGLTEDPTNPGYYTNGLPIQ